MKITALHIKRLASEMARDLPGCKISGLHKSESEKQILIQLVKGSQSWSLYFRFSGAPSFFYPVEGFDRKLATTNFLPQLLDGEIKTVEQVGFDRIVRLTIYKEGEKYSLIFELFGHSSNLFLTDSDNRIVTSIRKGTEKGVEYGAPETPDLLNPLEFDPKNPELQAIGDDPEPGEIAELFFGINEQIVQAAITKYSAASNDYWTALKKYCRELSDPDQPLFLDEHTGLLYLSDDEDYKRFDSIYQLLQYLSRQKPSAVKKRDFASEFKARLKRVLKREQKKVLKLDEAVNKAEGYSGLQREAELISMNMHLIKEGSESVKVKDIYSKDDSEIEINLDPALSPGKNVEHKFERAKRLRENIPRLKRQLSEARANLERLEQAQSEFDKITDGKVPDDLMSELEKLGVLAVSGRKKKSDDKPERLPYRHYKSSLGEDLWVGKSARDNDQLTFKHARKYDLWLHSQQTAGSHVILRRPNKSHQFQKRSIVEAAEAAAFFSAAKNADTVPVIYTEVRYVRKTRKGPPGQVIADRTRSILVEPRRPKN